LRRGVDKLRMALGQRVVPMAPKRRPSICDPRSELLVGAADVLPKVVLRKAGPPAALACVGDVTKDVREVAQAVPLARERLGCRVPLAYVSE
jgi:hypothetical protein